MMKVQRFVFNCIAENTYLAYDETREAVLIDCGCIRASEETELSEFIKGNGLVLKRLLCTHYHIDHIVGNAFIYRTCGIKPEMHIGEASAPSLKQQATGLGIPMANVEEIVPERFIADGEEIRFGNSVLKALFTPGHSPASLVFYCEESKTAFTGDVLFQGDIGRSDLWGGNHETLVSSIRNKLLVLPDETRIYPGHASSSTIGVERRTNPYLQ